MCPTNLAENVSTEETTNINTESAAVVVAEVKKPAGRQATPFEASMLQMVKDAAAKGNQPVGHKITDTEMTELGIKTAPMLAEISDSKMKIATASADVYALWSPVFPVRNGIKGTPDTLEFITRIYGMLPPESKADAFKPSNPSVPLSVTSAARYGNKVARGLVTMQRWCDENKVTLFSHLGFKAPDEDAKVLNRVENAIKSLTAVESSKYVPEKFFMEMVVITDTEGNVSYQPKRDAEVVSFRDILIELNTSIVLPVLEAKTAATKAEQDAIKSDREKELAKGEAEIVEAEQK